MTAAPKLYTLKVTVQKIEQDETGKPTIKQHKVKVQSHNLTLADTIDMQEGLLKGVAEWLKKDEE